MSAIIVTKGVRPCLLPQQSTSYFVDQSTMGTCMQLTLVIEAQSMTLYRPPQARLL